MQLMDTASAGPCEVFLAENELFVWRTTFGGWGQVATDPKSQNRGFNSSSAPISFATVSMSPL